jgi:hypothetical protein
MKSVPQVLKKVDPSEIQSMLKQDQKRIVHLQEKGNWIVHVQVKGKQVV